MEILFVHNNFPAQFKHVAPFLARQPGTRVTALHKREDLPDEVGGMRLRAYAPARALAPGIHPWLGETENALIHGEAAARRALAMRAEGYAPDVIIGHHGWGELIFLADIWPRAQIGVYCELYYRGTGSNWDFDPEFTGKPNPSADPRARYLNLPFDLSFDRAVSGLSPTQFQASTFPPAVRQRITVAHDGVDTDRIRPDSAALLPPGIAGDAAIRYGDEVITFVSRHLEPYRGFHIFMRALPAILKARPKARIVIVGADGSTGGYGPRPPTGTWKDRFTAELREAVPAQDFSRVHFVGRIAYGDFLTILQLSTVHVYLTYPFVLSWSLIEAMSTACAIVASDTEPVREVVEHGKTGILTDFFDVAALAERVIGLCDAPGERRRLGTAARRLAQARYSLQDCVPRQLRWIDAVARGHA